MSERLFKRVSKLFDDSDAILQIRNACTDKWYEMLAFDFNALQTPYFLHLLRHTLIRTMENKNLKNA